MLPNQGLGTTISVSQCKVYLYRTCMPNIVTIRGPFIGTAPAG